VKVELRVENADRVVALITSGQADLGFIEAAAAPAGLDPEVVATDELLVVCARSHPWAARAEGLDPEELARTRLVLREQGAGGRHLLELRLGGLGLRLAPPSRRDRFPQRAGRCRDRRRGPGGGESLGGEQ